MTDRCFIGVDLGGTKVSAGIVRGDQITKLEKRPVPSHKAADEILDHLIETIDRVFDDRVEGIGFGVPTVVDVAEGIVREAGNIPSWKEVHLKSALEDRFGVPAVINNDANAFAVGEHLYGKARGFGNVVGLTLGTGFGTGVIVDGRLYNGANCAAGELGMMPYRDGLLEDWCSGPFFNREYGVGTDILHRKARDGDRDAVAAFEHFGRELGRCVMVVLYAYDPEIVVFGGSIASAFDLFAPAMRKAFHSFEYPHAIDRLTLEVGALDHAAVLGAAALCAQTADSP